MQVLPYTLPTTVPQLQQLLVEQQALIEQHEKMIASCQAINKVLEEKLRRLNQKHFAKSSEKNPGQAELQFLNEAETLHWQQVQDELESDEQEHDVGQSHAGGRRGTRRHSQGIGVFDQSQPGATTLL